MSSERLSRRAELPWMRQLAAWAGASLLVVGVSYFLFLVTSSDFVAAVTDFEGDLAGVAAIERGISPYQTLGALADQIPDLDITYDLRNQWVVHSPLSLAGARAASAAFGDRAVDFARLVTIFGVLAGAGSLMRYAQRWGRLVVFSGLLGAVLLSVGLALDIYYVQGEVVLAALLASSLGLHRSGRKTLSLLVLGVAVAWRPWCAPIALFLPYSDSPTGDAMRVGSVAVGLTLIALPFVGGLESLWAWLTLALPENVAQYRAFPLNQSLTAAIWPAGGVITALVIVLLVATVRPRVSPDLRPTLGAISILGFLPLVWQHYWIGLVPVFIGRKAPRPLVLSLIAAFLLMGHLAGAWSPFLDRYGGRLGLLLVTVGLMVSIRSRLLPDRADDANDFPIRVLTQP